MSNINNTLNVNKSSILNKFILDTSELSSQLSSFLNTKKVGNSFVSMFWKTFSNSIDKSNKNLPYLKASIIKPVEMNLNVWSIVKKFMLNSSQYNDVSKTNLMNNLENVLIKNKSITDTWNPSIQKSLIEESIGNKTSWIYNISNITTSNMFKTISLLSYTKSKDKNLWDLILLFYKTKGDKMSIDIINNIIDSEFTKKPIKQYIPKNEKSFGESIVNMFHI